MDTNRDSAHQSQNEDNFPTFSLRQSSWMRHKGRKTTEKETPHQSRDDSLHYPRVKCNKFWQKDTLVKPTKDKLVYFNL